MSVEQRNNPKLLMGIMGALVTVVALVLLYQWLNASSGEAERMHQEDIVAVPAAKPAAKTEDTAAAKAAEAIEAKALVSEQLLDSPVPENASLAKEEVAKLDDIQVQLNEQKATLDAQHSDADQLIQLKEEQIKLLEAQLAQSQ